ncbi:MAG: hypothetical protein HRU26_08030 [Psychroserpens sp.]|nr:hypothetical protein [Psychroserpens sp.]
MYIDENLIRILTPHKGETIDVSYAISLIKTIAKEYEQKQLLLHNVVQAKPEKVCELIRQKFDDWVFGLETQSGEKLKVVDSTDFNDIITEIESELKDL